MLDMMDFWQSEAKYAYARRVLFGKKILTFFIALLTAWLLYSSLLEVLFVLSVAIGQFILDMSPVLLTSYTEKDWFVLSEIILTLIIAVILYYYHRRYSWRIIWGFGLCLTAIAFIILLLAVFRLWYIDIDFINGLLSDDPLEELSLATPIHAVIFLIFWLIILGGIGIVLLKKWRTLIAALSTIISIVLLILIWAKVNNITGNCFINGYWEGSPVYKKIITDTENSDDPRKVVSGIISISRFYLSGSLVAGDSCYTSDDKTRYALLKKYIFYYPYFIETDPRLQDIIAEKAEDNDVPAMLLLAYMYNHGHGVEADKAQGEAWLTKALSYSSDAWVLEEKEFILDKQ